MDRCGRRSLMAHSVAGFAIARTTALPQAPAEMARWLQSTWRGSINVTLLLPKLATHTSGSPKATETFTPNGLLPTGTVASTVPSDGRTAVTLLLPLFATHIRTPSNAIPAGP